MPRHDATDRHEYIAGHVTKEQKFALQIWADRRGISLSAALALAIRYLLDAHPIEKGKVA